MIFIGCGNSANYWLVFNFENNQLAFSLPTILCVLVFCLHGVANIIIRGSTIILKEKKNWIWRFAFVFIWLGFESCNTASKVNRNCQNNIQPKVTLKCTFSKDWSMSMIAFLYPKCGAFMKNVTYLPCYRFTLYGASCHLLLQDLFCFGQQLESGKRKSWEHVDYSGPFMKK